MLPLIMEYILKEFIPLSGESYFKKWFVKQAANAAAKITAALYKLEQGNFSNVKFLASDLWEFKIDSGPGYRIYFTKVDTNIILLLTGGIKRTQKKDIILAKQLLKEFKSTFFH